MRYPYTLEGKPPVRALLITPFYATGRRYRKLNSGGKYGHMRVNTDICRYLPWGQITNTDFYLLLDMQKRTYCNKTCDNKRLLQYIFHIIIFLSHILHWPFPSIDFYIAKKIFELTNCENKSLRELTLFNLQIFLFRVWFKKYTMQCRSVQWR